MKILTTALSSPGQAVASRLRTRKHVNLLGSHNHENQAPFRGILGGAGGCHCRSALLWLPIALGVYCLIQEHSMTQNAALMSSMLFVNTTTTSLERDGIGTIHTTASTLTSTRSQILSPSATSVSPKQLKQNEDGLNLPPNSKPVLESIVSSKHEDGNKKGSSRVKDKEQGSSRENHVGQESGRSEEQGDSATRVQQGVDNENRETILDDDEDDAIARHMASLGFKFADGGDETNAGGDTNSSSSDAIPFQQLGKLLNYHRAKADNMRFLHATDGSRVPDIVWLTSYPNSGTSYTMTLVERASNLSTATHYGATEVTPSNRISLPIHYLHEHEYYNRHSIKRNASDDDGGEDVGPFWEGIEGAVAMKRTPRILPSTFVLTKTHCGGRCLKCKPLKSSKKLSRADIITQINDGDSDDERSSATNEYIQLSTRSFLHGCLRTTGYYYKEQPKSTNVDDGRVLEIRNKSSAGEIEYREGKISPSRVKKMVHLVRSPFDNVVARFHLDNRHLKRKAEKNGGKTRYYPSNATGFIDWCTNEIDAAFQLNLIENQGILRLEQLQQQSPQPENQQMPLDLLVLIQQIHCGIEFYKYAQWHTKLIDIVPMLGKDSNTKEDEKTADPSSIADVHNSVDNSAKITSENANGTSAESFHEEEEAEQSNIKVLQLYYEDYQNNWNRTVKKLMKFVQHPIQAEELREFRALPDYSDHFDSKQRKLIKTLIKKVASWKAYEMIRKRYL